MEEKCARPIERVVRANGSVIKAQRNGQHLYRTHQVAVRVEEAQQVVQVLLSDSLVKADTDVAILEAPQVNASSVGLPMKWM